MKPDAATVTAHQSGSYDFGRGEYSGSVRGTIVGTRQQEYANQVDVELTATEGRIRFPRSLLPVLHGGADGWFQLKNLKITDRAISGSASINVINHPKVYIDRLSGVISINAREGDFTGRCEAIDETAQRKF